MLFHSRRNDARHCSRYTNTNTHTHTQAQTQVYCLHFYFQFNSSPHLTSNKEAKPNRKLLRARWPGSNKIYVHCHTRGEKFATPFSLAHANNGTIWVSCHVRIPLQKWLSRANGGELLVKDFSREAFVFRVAMPSGSKLEVIFGDVDNHLHFLGFPVYRMWT